MLNIQKCEFLGYYAIMFARKTFRSDGHDLTFFFTYYDLYVTSGVKTFLTNSEPRDLHVCVHMCVRCVCGVYICMFVFMYLFVVCVVFMCTCVSLWCAGCVSISVNVYVECVYGDIFIPISESVFYIFVFEIDRWL